MKKLKQLLILFSFLFIGCGSVFAATPSVTFSGDMNDEVYSESTTFSGSSFTIPANNFITLDQVTFNLPTTQQYDEYWNYSDSKCLHYSFKALTSVNNDYGDYANHWQASHSMLTMLYSKLTYLDSSTMQFDFYVDFTCNNSNNECYLGNTGITFENTSDAFRTNNPFYVINSSDKVFSYSSPVVEEVSCQYVQDLVNKSEYDEIVAEQEKTNDKLDEANTTSKGIWQTIKDGFDSFYEWFGSIVDGLNQLSLDFGEFMDNLLNGIVDFFIGIFKGEETTTCNTYTNYFTSFTKQMSMAAGSFSTTSLTPDSEGWYTFNPGRKFVYLVEHIENLKPNTEYTVFVETQEGSTLQYFEIGMEHNSKYTTYIGDLNVSLVGNFFSYTFTTPEDLTSKDYVFDVSYNNTSSTDIITARFMIVESGYSDYEYEYFTGTKEVCTDGSSDGGLFGIITGGINSIGQWFQDLLQGILDGLQSLLVPTEEQLNTIIDKSKDLSENFGFVGESVAFFLDIFTSLLSITSSNGCVTLPGFTVPMSQTSFGGDDVVFWEEQTTCLADNIILNDNIETIRTITSIALVCLFVTFAARQFFKILSKESDEETSSSSSERSKKE